MDADSNAPGAKENDGSRVGLSGYEKAVSGFCGGGTEEIMVSVLVVDDEPTVLRNISRSLHKAGFQVLTAMNCEGAGLAVTSGRIDALCLDIKLPDGNGLDLLEEIRQTQPDLPVILISGALTSEVKSRAAALGVRHFLQKPFSLAGLKDVLAKSLVSI